MNRDFDTDEKEFSNEIANSLGNLRANAGPCPHPDLVMAAAAGVLTDNRERILQHLNACPICKQLTHDLSEYEFPGVSTEEDRRIRARWETPSISRKQSWVAWIHRPFAIGALSAIVLVAIALVVTQRRVAPRQNPAGSIVENTSRPEPPSSPPPAKIRTTFVLSKAAIKIPAAAVLTFRSGAEESRAFMNEFASALGPYRSDNFGEAARRLGSLAEKYPNSAEVHYYLGVSRLFLDQNGAALESLETARRLANEELRDDVSWYLALALDRAGRLDDARREVATLCGRAGGYQRQACAAAEELK